MRKSVMYTTTAMCVVLSAPAYAADCNGEMQTLNQEFSQNTSNYRVIAGSGLTTEIRELRNAAQIFARNGQEDACQNVVSGIRDLLDEQREQLAKSDKATDRDAWFETEQKRLAGAIPLDQVKSPTRASKVIGTDVRNMKNEHLGEIEDLIVAQKEGGGQPQYAILARGGFLGLGEKQVAVPWQEFKVTTDGMERVYVLDMSKEVLDNAPSFDSDTWAEIVSADWRKQNDNYFKQHRL